MGLSKFNLHTQRINQIAIISKVFSHPARVAILKYISEQDGYNCNELADAIGLSQPTISQHLTVIGNEGLLKGVFKGKNKYYSINMERFEEFQMLLNVFFNKAKSNCS